jgi:acetyltransferase-like isoleucine patch superfamily enzyme
VNTATRVEQVGIVEVSFGENVTVVEPVNLYGCSIGRDSFIGPFVEVQKDVVIGARCRVQSHSFLCELVELGDDCFIGHGAMFINDLFATGAPAPRDPSHYLRTCIGNNVSIGSNATILPVQIADGIVIGAGSVVTEDLLIRGIYAGNPARLLRKL